PSLRLLPPGCMVSGSATIESTSVKVGFVGNEPLEYTSNNRRVRSSRSCKCKRLRSNPERDEGALPAPRVAFTLTDWGQSDRSLPLPASGAAPAASTRQGYGVANMHQASWSPTSSIDGSRCED